MKLRWLNPAHKSEASALLKVSTEAEKKTESLDNSPSKKVLDLETQKYIEERFPKTNDDKLHEDTAKKFIFDSKYLDDITERHNNGEKMEKQFSDKLWEMYTKAMESDGYIEVYKDMSKRVGKLIDNMNILEIHNSISPEKFPLAKSGISNKEAFLLAKEEAENVKHELGGIRDENISKESVGELLDKYKKISEKYNTLRSVLQPENPDLN